MENKKVKLRKLMGQLISLDKIKVKDTLLDCVRDDVGYDHKTGAGTDEFWSKWNMLCDFIEEEYPDIAKESRI